MRKPKKLAEPPPALVLHQMVLNQRDMIAKIEEMCEELDEYSKELAKRLQEKL